MLKYITLQSKNFEFEKAFSIETLNSSSEIPSSGPNSTASIEGSGRPSHTYSGKLPGFPIYFFIK